MPPTDLKEKENTESGLNKSSDTDKAVGDLERSFASPSATDNDLPAGHPSKTKKGSLKRLLTPKKALIGVGTTLVVSGSLFFVNLIGGPLELLHLSNILDRTSQPTQSMMRSRTGSMLRNARAAQTGDIGESRVSRIGSRIFSNVTNQLANIGVEFSDRSSRTGRPGVMSVDGNRHPQFRDIPGGPQREAAVARHYGINQSRVSTVSGRVIVDLQGYSAGAVRALVDTSLRNLEDGRVKTAMNKRVMAKFFNVPSLFRPFQRVQADTEQRLDTRAQRRQTERERKATKRPTLSPRYQSAIDTAKSRLQGWSGRIAVLTTLQGVYCNIYGVRDLLPLINYAQVVVPASIESIDKRAVPAQLQAGENVSLAQANAVVESFSYDAQEAINEIGADNLDIEDIEQMEANDGKSIWSGKALSALANNNSGAGQEIDPGYKLAFSGQLEGENLSSLFEDSVAGSITCSTAGMVVGGVLGTALAFVPVAGWKARAAIAGGQTLLFMAATNVITGIVIDRTSEHAMEVFSGPQGGNLLAYGARASNNMNAQSMGGVELSNTQTAALLREANERERLELQERSFAQRTLDISDHRSVLGQTYRSLSTKFEAGFLKGLFSLFNPVTLFSSISNSITSVVRADTNESYDWGFPVYGVPLDILNNDKYEDPYYNASVVTTILDTRDSRSEDLIERAEICFGVRVVNQSGEWNVLRDEAVNPLEDDYIDADCDDLSDEDWARMMLFVFDNSIITALDCYEGNRVSCNDLGIGASSPQQAGDINIDTEGGFVGVDTSNLVCPDGSSDMGTVLVPTGENLPSDIQQTEIRLCDIPGISTGTNVIIAQNVIDLLAAAEQDGLSLTGTNFRSSERQAELRVINGCPDVYESPASTCDIPTARPGSSMHEHGLAIDFRNCAERSTQCYQWLDRNAADFGLINLPSEPWHWSTNGR